VLFVILAIPLINLIDAFHQERMLNLGESLGVGDPGTFAETQPLIGAILLVIVLFAASFFWYRAEKGKVDPVRTLTPVALFVYATYYMVYGFIVKGFFYRNLSMGDSDFLYTPVLLVAFGLWFINRKNEVTLPLSASAEESLKKWLLLIIGMMVILSLITFISVNAHSGLPGFHTRF
jgi:hypothetical protein